MRWQDLDLEEGWWNLPGTMTKNGKPHRVPLLGLWVERVRPLIIEAKDHDVWVFPSPRKDGQPLHALSVPPYCRRVSEAVGVSFTAKDFRTTFVTTLRELRVDKETTQKLVNHMEGETIDEHYDLYDYDAPKVDAMLRYDAHLRAVLFGEAARVVSIGSRRAASESPR